MEAVYVIYNLLLAFALLASAPYWLVRLLRQGKYREGVCNRLGMLPPHLRSLAAAGKPVIWVHAVSVGEILAVAGLIEEMRKRFAGYAIAISTTTGTGYKLAGGRFGAVARLVVDQPVEQRWLKAALLGSPGHGYLGNRTARAGYNLQIRA